MIKRRIMIPLDGSEFRNQALSLVYKVFDPANTELLLLFVESTWGLSGTQASYYALAGDVWYYPGDGVLLTQSAEEQEQFRAKQAALLQKEAVALRKAGYTVSTKVLTGDLASTAIKEAKKASVDVIAMVTHGRTGINRMLYGSVADQILRESSVPVMMMRAPMPVAIDSEGAFQGTGAS
ncbi:MAG: universal stress protein [Chloroflexota bacterium]